MRRVFVFKADNIVDPSQSTGMVFKSRAVAIRQTKPYSLERSFVKVAVVGDKLILHKHPIVHTIEVTWGR